MKTIYSAIITCSLMLGIFSINLSGFSQVTITGSLGFPTGSALNGLAYGNSQYIAVGAAGYIIKSTDGANWSVVKTSSFLNVSYTRVIYANSLFVAVGSAGTIATSADGTNWVQRTSGTVNQLTDIAYGSGKFVAVGYNNTAVTSADGLTWTSLNVGAGSSDYLLTIVYAAGKFVIGERDYSSGNSRSIYSTTGAAGTWSNVYIETTGRSVNKLLYINNKFYCFTVFSDIYTSNDAISWSSMVNARLASPNQVSSGFYDGTTYYFIGSCPDFSGTAIFTSTDGTNFTLQAQKSTIVAQNAVFANGRYFILGNEGLISATSGSNWSFPAGVYNAIASNGSRFVAVGQTTGSEAAIFTSTDWNNWTNVSPTVFKPLNGITYANGKFVAVGNVDASGFGTIASSADGLTWTVSNSGIADNLRAVAYGNGKYVAVGLNGRIIYSSDGTTWTSAENGSGYHYYGIAYLNNYFIAVGGNTTINAAPKVKYSTNGTSWTDASPSISGQFHGIAYDGTKYLLVGRDNTSGSQKFFSVTTTNITSAASYSSTSTVSTPEGDVGTAGFGGVAFNNSTFTAFVNLKVSPFSAYILTSSDGASWTATAANTTARLRGIIPSGSSFKVVGTLDTRLNISLGLTLPLRLTNFSVTRNNGISNLNWNTVDEENVSHFEIESGNNGRTFKKIAEMVASNTTGSHSYFYSDATVQNGVIYYRLKMVDIDGRSTYSQVLKTGDVAKETMISVYPNPVTDYITLTRATSRTANIKLFTREGKEVFQQTISSDSEIFYIGDLPTGIYIMQITQDGKTYTEKVLKR